MVRFKDWTKNERKSRKMAKENSDSCKATLVESKNESSEL